MVDLDPTTDEFFAPPPGQGRGPRPHLKFYTKPIQLAGKTAEAGRAIYEERDYVDITNPGSRDTTPMIAADAAKQDEYVAWAYNKWKKTQQQVVDGTPIETVPWLNKAQVEELKYLNINSLETLANLPDSAKSRFHGALDLSKKAQAYMAAAKDTALVTKLQDELAKRDRDIAAMQKQMKEVNERFEALQKKAG